jgi:hypothetical protein
MKVGALYSLALLFYILIIVSTTAGVSLAVYISIKNKTMKVLGSICFEVLQSQLHSVLKVYRSHF